MGGGLIQLVAYGGQDIHLTGNPEFSYFKSVHRRHTNFAIECIEQHSISSITNKDFTANYEIGRHGDLLHKMHLEIDLPEQDIRNESANGYCAYTNTTGYAFMKNVELLIGGESIDKHTGTWYDIHTELSDIHSEEGYLINKNDIGTILTYKKPQKLRMYVPLKFWFCRDISQALPLIALQYHSVNLKFNFRSIKHIINTKQHIIDGVIQDTSHVTPSSTNADEPLLSDIKLWCNYIYLDSDERKRFAQSAHEYLIEQVQEIKDTFKERLPIPFNHSVKALYWVVQNDIANSSTNDYSKIDNSKNIRPITTEVPWINRNDFLNYRTHTTNNPSFLNSLKKYEHFEKAKIIINGLDRTSFRDAIYYRTIQPHEVGYKIPEKNIYMYSFSLKPNEFQPSGACNFSKIDSASLEFTGELEPGYTISVYAVNYNILRIMSGFGGLLYSS